jgi:hypothetical protein
VLVEGTTTLHRMSMRLTSGIDRGVASHRAGSFGVRCKTAGQAMHTLFRSRVSHWSEE